MDAGNNTGNVTGDGAVTGGGVLYHVMARTSKELRRIHLLLEPLPALHCSSIVYRHCRVSLLLFIVLRLSTVIASYIIAPHCSITGYAVAFFTSILHSVLQPSTTYLHCLLPSVLKPSTIIACSPTCSPFSPGLLPNCLIS